MDYKLTQKDIDALLKKHPEGLWGVAWIITDRLFRVKYDQLYKDEDEKIYQCRKKACAIEVMVWLGHHYFYSQDGELDVETLNFNNIMARIDKILEEKQNERI